MDALVEQFQQKCSSLNSTASQFSMSSPSKTTTELQTELKKQERAVGRLLELIEEHVEQQARDDEPDCEASMQMLSQLQSEYSKAQQAVRRARRQYERNLEDEAKAERLLLLQSDNPQEMQQKLQSEDQLVDKAGDITTSLQRTRQIMLQEVDHTEATLAAMDFSEKTLKGAKNEFKGHRGHHKRSQALLGTMKRHSLMDTLTLWGGFAIFLTTVAYVVGKRSVYFVPQFARDLVASPFRSRNVTTPPVNVNEPPKADFTDSSQPVFTPAELQNEAAQQGAAWSQPDLTESADAKAGLSATVEDPGGHLPVDNASSSQHDQFEGESEKSSVEIASGEANEPANQSIGAPDKKLNVSAEQSEQSQAEFEGSAPHLDPNSSEGEVLSLSASLREDAGNESGVESSSNAQEPEAVEQGLAEGQHFSEGSEQDSEGTGSPVDQAESNAEQRLPQDHAERTVDNAIDQSEAALQKDIDSGLQRPTADANSGDNNAVSDAEQPNTEGAGILQPEASSLENNIENEQDRNRKDFEPSDEQIAKARQEVWQKAKQAEEAAARQQEQAYPSAYPSANTIPEDVNSQAEGNDEQLLQMHASPAPASEGSQTDSEGPAALDNPASLHPPPSPVAKPEAPVPSGVPLPVSPDARDKHNRWAERVPSEIPEPFAPSPNTRQEDTELGIFRPDEL